MHHKSARIYYIYYVFIGRFSFGSREREREKRTIETKYEKKKKQIFKVEIT